MRRNSRNQRDDRINRARQKAATMARVFADKPLPHNDPFDRNRMSRARRAVVKIGYRLEKVPHVDLWHLLYTAAGDPPRPVLAGPLEAIERWLAERKRT